MREDEAHQIWVDALEKGVRTEEYLDGTTIKFREIMARPGGEEGDLLIRHGLETIMDDGTTRVTTTYLDPKDPGATVMVTSLRHDGLETITGLTGKSDLKLGDSRDIPASLTTAAGLAPSTFDPKADGSFGFARPTSHSTSTDWSDSSSSSTSSTFGSSTSTTDQHDGMTHSFGNGSPDTSVDHTDSPAAPSTDDHDGGSTPGSSGSAIDDALSNLDAPSNAEPDVPSSRGGDASTDGLSWVEPTSAHADDVLNDAEMTTVGGLETNADGSVTRDEVGGGTVTYYSDHTATMQDSEGNPTGDTMTDVTYKGQTSGESSSAGDSSSQGVQSGSASDSSHPGDGTDGDGGDAGDKPDSGSGADSGGSDDTGEEGYVDNDPGGYSYMGPQPPAEQGIGHDTAEVSDGSSHSMMTYSGAFGTFAGTPEHAQEGNPHTVWGDYGNPNDENATEVPTDSHIGPPSDDPLIHVEPDADGGSGAISIEQHEFQTSIHGGDFGDPNDPLFGDGNVPAGDHGDTSPYEHGTGDAESAFDDDGLP